MILAALGFVFGAWLLQQQAVLPFYAIGLQAAWILVPALGVFAFINLGQFQLYLALNSVLKKISHFTLAVLLGFVWAANYAAIRLSDELPADWQQKSITIIGEIGRASCRERVLVAV